MNDKDALQESHNVLLERFEKDIIKRPSPPPPPLPLPWYKKISKKVFIIAGIICALLLVGGGWMYLRLRIAQTPEALKTEVGTLIELPNETPTIATVTDPHELTSELFFKDAQVGDKVLIFSKAGQAILYRPSEKKIIAVGAVKH